MKNIRLVEERRRTRQMVDESGEWLYYAIAGVIIGLLITLAPVVRAWASLGW